MQIQIELILLVLSTLFLFSMLAGKASSKFGVPALLLFLAVGMLSGTDGLGIEFNNLYIAQSIGTVALCIILFSGGLDTKISEIKPVMARGLMLSTFGVFLTAFIAGVLIWMVAAVFTPSAGIGLLTALLLASTMSSTDSASVFSILRSKGLNLKNNLRPMLELESGSNDPVAYILVITFIEILKMDSNPDYLIIGGRLLLQLGIGALFGYILGKLAVILINRLHIDNDSLYPILVFTFCMFIFSVTYFAGGNSYLAVYISGIVIGNSKFVHKRSAINFFDGLAWLFQLIMFLTLGLLVNPRELLPVIIPGLIISILMIFIARPLSVYMALLPFPKMPKKDKVYVSWVGLRGAVPIIFAIYPLAADIPHSNFIFNIVFFCTLVSLVVQGTTLTSLAGLLGLIDKPKRNKRLKNFDIDFSDEIKSITSEITITNELLKSGNHLMDLSLPEQTLAVMVKRGDKYFIPTGNTILHDRDKLLIITDNQEALNETYKNLGLADPE